MQRYWDIPKQNIHRQEIVLGVHYERKMWEEFESTAVYVLGHPPSHVNVILLVVCEFVSLLHC